MRNKISDWMTRAPHTIGENIALSKAQHMLRELKVRHLPVRYGGKLVGVISDRDIHLALSVYPQADKLLVGDIMSEQPYTVAEDTDVATAAGYMATHKIGSAVVMDREQKVVGVFTTTDALHALSRFAKP